MKPGATSACFQARLRRPADLGDEPWAFVILPKPESDKFARRGRTGAQVSVNGHVFQVVLEPDGQLSHWFRIPAVLLEGAAVEEGDLLTLAVQPLIELRAAAPVSGGTGGARRPQVQARPAPAPANPVPAPAPRCRT